MEQKTEVFEVTDTEGEVVEQFSAVEQNPEELLTNVEALEKMEIEAVNEGLFKEHVPEIIEIIAIHPISES